MNMNLCDRTAGCLLWLCRRSNESFFFFDLQLRSSLVVDTLLLDAKPHSYLSAFTVRIVGMRRIVATKLYGTLVSYSLL